jgi:serine/threonine protein kinase
MRKESFIGNLQPSNIKLTPKGKVKVLDFGLAKAYEREQPNVALSNSPTISMAATNGGRNFGYGGLHVAGTGVGKDRG